MPHMEAVHTAHGAWLLWLSSLITFLRSPHFTKLEIVRCELEKKERWAQIGENFVKLLKRIANLWPLFKMWFWIIESVKKSWQNKREFRKLWQHAARATTWVGNRRETDFWCKSFQEKNICWCNNMFNVSKGGREM